MIRSAYFIKLFLCLFLVCFLSIETYAESFCSESKSQHSESAHSESEQPVDGHCYHHCFGSMLFFSDLVVIVFAEQSIQYQIPQKTLYSENDFEALFKPPIS